MDFCDIGILNATKGGWFSTLQRKITGQNVTHCIWGIGDLGLGIQSTIGADLKTSVTSDIDILENPSIEYYIFTIDIPRDHKLEISRYLYKKYNNLVYSFFQLPWFVWRAIQEQVFHKDIRKKKNWGSGEEPICSEIHYVGLYEVIDFMKDPYNKFDLYKVRLLENKLNEWNADTVHVGDILNILFYFCETYPDVFKLKEKHLIG